MKKLLVFLLTFVLLAGGCSAGKPAEGVQTVKIALTGEKSEVWEDVKDRLADENINLELVFFADYIIPNTALADGDVDLNAFQTDIFLQNYEKESGQDFTVLAHTVLAPMGIYAGTKGSVDAIAEGDRIAIPNDPTNGGRALILLQAAGLIRIDPAAGLTPVLKDVIENPKNLEIVELAAPQIPTVLDEVAVGIINNGIAVTAGFAPLEDAIFIEDQTQQHIENYYNVIAVRTDRKDEPALNKVIEVYKTDRTKELIAKESKGSSVPVF